MGEMQGAVLRSKSPLRIFIHPPEEDDKMSFETHILLVAVLLLQVLMASCALRPDTDRYLHWMCRDLVGKKAGVTW